MKYDTGYVDGLIEAQLKIYGYNFIEDVISEEFAERFIKSNLGTYEFPENSRCNYKALVAQHYISVKVAEQERLPCSAYVIRFLQCRHVYRQ
mgnify:CR=1 FL=1